MTYNYKYLDRNPDGGTNEILFHFVYLSQEQLAKSFEVFFKNNYSWSPTQTHLLCYLKYYDTISMSELSDLMNSSRQHMTQLIDNLSEKGLAKRTYDSKNRRAVNVQPTDLALKQLDTGERRFISHLQRNIAQLSEEEQKKTIEAIKITSNFLSNLTFESKDITDALL